MSQLIYPSAGGSVCSLASPVAPSSGDEVGGMPFSGITLVAVKGGWRGQPGVMTAAVLCIASIAGQEERSRLLQEGFYACHYLETDRWAAYHINTLDMPLQGAYSRRPLVPALTTRLASKKQKIYQPLVVGVSPPPPECHGWESVQCPPAPVRRLSNIMSLWLGKEKKEVKGEEEEEEKSTVKESDQKEAKQSNAETSVETESASSAGKVAESAPEDTLKKRMGGNLKEKFFQNEDTPDAVYSIEKLASDMREPSTPGNTMMRKPRFGAAHNPFQRQRNPALEIHRPSSTTPRSTPIEASTQDTESLMMPHEKAGRGSFYSDTVASFSKRQEKEIQKTKPRNCQIGVTRMTPFTDTISPKGMRPQPPPKKMNERLRYLNALKARRGEAAVYRLNQRHHREWFFNESVGEMEERSAPAATHSSQGRKKQSVSAAALAAAAAPRSSLTPASPVDLSAKAKDVLVPVIERLMVEADQTNPLYAVEPATVAQNLAQGVALKKTDETLQERITRLARVERLDQEREEVVSDPDAHIPSSHRIRQLMAQLVSRLEDAKGHVTPGSVV